MNRCRRWLATFAHLLTASFLFAWIPTDGGVWPDGSIPVALEFENHSSNSPGTWQAAANTAMATWNAQLQRVQLTAAPANGQPNYDNGRNEMYFGTQAYGETFPSGVLALAYSTSYNGQRVEGDVIFSWHEPWGVYSGPLQNGTTDFQRTALHELGHVLGLHHPDEHRQSVDAVMNSHISDTATLTADDRAGAHALYDRGTGLAATILRGPTVNASPIMEGQRTRLEVSVGGRGPFTYSWRRNGQTIPGATSRQFDIPISTRADAGEYSVVITNPGGSITSSGFRLNVEPAIPPRVVPSSPPDARVVTVGDQYVLRTNDLNRGTGITLFEWFRNGRYIGKSTFDGFPIENIQFSDAGTYTVRASNIAGSAQSTVAHLSVRPAEPIRIVKMPVSRAARPGENISFNVETDGQGQRSLQWHKDGRDIPAATSAYLSLSSVQPHDAGTFSVTVTTAAGTIASTPARLDIIGLTSPPIIIRAAASKTIHVGQDSGLTVECEGSDLTYRWFKNNIELPGENRNAISIWDATLDHAGSYRVEVSNPAGMVSSTAQLIVNPAPKPLITRQPASQFVGSGETVELSVGALLNYASGYGPSQYGYTYQWYKDGAPLDIFGTNLRFIAASDTQGRYFARVSTPDGRFTDSKIVDVTLTSDPLRLITYMPGDILFNAGDSEELRLGQLLLQVIGRRSARGAEVGVEIVGAGGPTFGSITAGTYVIVATRDGITETSTPFVVGFLPPMKPVFLQGPANQTVDIGQRVEIWAPAAAYELLSFQWTKDGQILPNATDYNLVIEQFTAGDTGDYELIAMGSMGSTTSTSATLQLRSFSLPIITHHPGSMIIKSGFMAPLEIDAVGGNISFQWLKNGQPIGGANEARYNAHLTGDYSVVVSNGSGSVTSRPARITVLETDEGPIILHQPVDQSASYGSDVTFTVAATGDPLPDVYQWQKNGADIPGATDVELRLSQVDTSATGTYRVRVSNVKGTVTSNPATLTVDARARLANLSTRAESGKAGDVLIAGFVVGGKKPRTVLVRGIGDQLRDFGVEGVLVNPTLKLFDSRQKLVASNDDWTLGENWSNNSREWIDALEEAAREAGAFPLQEESLSAALIAELAPGSYTAQVSGAVNTTGVALVELYELGKPEASRLINLSSRAFVGTGGRILIPGLALSGAAPRRLLVRAVGPGLEPFKVENRLEDPVLTVFREKEAIAQNDNWTEQSGTNALIQSTAEAGAFALSPGSRDAVLLIDLPPGTYTIQVAGKNDTTGIALVEVYEVP